MKNFLVSLIAVLGVMLDEGAEMQGNEIEHHVGRREYWPQGQ